MNILDMIGGAGGGGAVQQIAAKFGLPPEQAAAAMGALLPALTGGIKRNLASESGAAGLETALLNGQHERYLDQPETLASPATIDDGNGILGHVLGSKDVSRQVAAQASQQTGIDPEILKKLLPVVAAVAMGALAKRAKGGGATAGGGLGGALGGALGGGLESGGATAGRGGGIGALLGPLLDRDGDGSPMNDVAGMLGGMLGRKR